MSRTKRELPRFKSQSEEVEFWMKHDTADFWDAFEDLEEPLQAAPNLLSEIKARHERTKPISIRLYPSRLRVAKAMAHKRHIPYQTLLRNLIDRGLSQLAAEGFKPQRRSA